jgi:hypothetical protein
MPFDVNPRFATRPAPRLVVKFQESDAISAPGNPVSRESMIADDTMDQEEPDSEPAYAMKSTEEEDVAYEDARGSPRDGEEEEEEVEQTVEDGADEEGREEEGTGRDSEGGNGHEAEEGGKPSVVDDGHETADDVDAADEPSEEARDCGNPNEEEDGAEEHDENGNPNKQNESGYRHDEDEGTQSDGENQKGAEADEEEEETHQSDSGLFETTVDYEAPGVIRTEVTASAEFDD